MDSVLSEKREQFLTERLAECGAELDALRRFVAFVNLWSYRESENLTDGERLSAIKYHPTARKAAKDAGFY